MIHNVNGWLVVTCCYDTALYDVSSDGGRQCHESSLTFPWQLTLLVLVNQGIVNIGAAEGEECQWRISEFY